MEGRLFSFSHFFLLFPHNGGLSQTPFLFLSQHPFQKCGAGLSLHEEVWARHEQERLEVESSKEKARPLAVRPASPMETSAAHHARPAKSGPSFSFLQLLPFLLIFLLRLWTLTKLQLQLFFPFHRDCTHFLMSIQLDFQGLPVIVSHAESVTWLAFLL